MRISYGSSYVCSSDLVAARSLRVCAEDDRRAVIDADLPGHAAGEGAVLILQLKARGDVVITTEIVLLGRRDIVDPVVAVLVEAREADRKAAVVGSSRRDLDLARALAAIADARMAAVIGRAHTRT